MLAIVYSPNFFRTYKRLETSLKEEIREAIFLFVDPKNHVKLKVHKLKALDNTYSFSVNYRVRIIFEYENEKTKNAVNLLKVGPHDEVY